MMPAYPNLPSLLSGSSSTRRYFLSLPVWLQVLLHQEYSRIRTAEELHRTAECLSRAPYKNKSRNP